MATQIIQLILAPVVMVSAAAILLVGLLGRYAAINDRLRTLSIERLELLARANSDDCALQLGSLAPERLEQIDRQVPELLRRHRLSHDSVLAAYIAVATYLVSMFAIAAAVGANWHWLSTLVLLLFLAGTMVLLGGVALTVTEVHSSHRAVTYEARRVLSLRHPTEERPTAGHGLAR